MIVLVLAKMAAQVVISVKEEIPKSKIFVVVWKALFIAGEGSTCKAWKRWRSLPDVNASAFGERLGYIPC